MKEINNYTIKDATHLLECTHQYNHRSSVDYHMPCLILKTMPNGRLKILVFGDRRTKLEYTNGKKRIRYGIHPSRLKDKEEINNENKIKS